METRNLLDFDSTETPLSSDWLHINQGGVDKKISFDNFIESVNGGNPFNISVKTESSDARTLTIADRNSYITCLDNVQTTILLQNTATHGWKNGDTIIIQKGGNGNVLFNAASGVTIKYPPSGSALVEVNQAGQLLCFDAANNIWHLLTGGNARASLTGQASFLSVDALKSGVTVEGVVVDFSVLAAQNAKVSTVYNNTTSNEGGADYFIVNVNPGNLSTLVGGIWVGANHDLGGGRYAKIHDDNLTLESFGSTRVNDDSAALQSLLNYANTFGTATIANKRSILDKASITAGEIDFDHVNIIGNDNKIKAAAGASFILRNESSGYWDYVEVRGLRLDGNSKASNGLTFLNAFGGRLVLDRVKIEQCDIGIEKPNGNIGNTYRDLSVAYCNYGAKFTAQTTPLIMHSGADVFYHGHFGFCDTAAVYINSPAEGTGQIVFDGTIFEQNAGFAIFVKNFQGAGNPLELRNVWFEANHTAANVTIDGDVLVPRDIYFKDVSQAKISQCVLSSAYFENSDVTIEQCKSFGGVSIVGINTRFRFYNTLITPGFTLTNCRAVAYDADVGIGVMPPIDIKSAKALREGSIFFSSNLLTPTSNIKVDGGTYVASYDGNSPHLSLIPTLHDGNTFQCCLKGTASGAGRIDAYTWTAVASKLYYVKCEIRLDTVDVPEMLLQGTGNIIAADFGSLLKKDVWVTVHLIGRATNNGTVNFWCNANGNSIGLSFGACTVVEVTDVQIIQNFFNSGSHIRKSNGGQFYAAAIPSTAVGMLTGDICTNTAATVDANNMILDHWRYDGAVWQPQYLSTTSPAA